MSEGWQHVWDAPTDFCKRCGFSRAAVGDTACRPVGYAAYDFPAVARRLAELEADSVRRLSIAAD